MPTHEVRRSLPPAGVPQNLACGVLEAQPPAEEEPEDEPLEDLRMPPQQTAAVAEAAQAGRSLVSEVEE